MRAISAGATLLRYHCAGGGWDSEADLQLWGRFAIIDPKSATGTAVEALRLPVAFRSLPVDTYVALVHMYSGCPRACAEN